MQKIAVKISNKNASTFAIVDDEDAKKVSLHKWRQNGCGYAITDIYGKTVRMHHLILGTPKKGLEVDHINRNGMDNRKNNLRFVNRSQNQLNRSPSTKSASQYKGINQRANGKWQSRICIAGKRVQIGTFETESEAADAYKLASNKYWESIA